MPTRFSMLDDQDGFNAATLDVARRFTLTPEQAQRINASAWRDCDLKSAMVAHIWAATLERVSAKLGCVLMPRWIENGLGHAWDAHGAEFMAIARDKLASAERLAA